MTAPPRRLIWITGGLLILLLLIVVFRPEGTSSTSQFWTFEVELRAASGTSAQLFWTSDGNFSEKQSAREPIQGGAPNRTLRFTLPRGVRQLRLDPTDAPGDVVIGRMALRDAAGRVLTTFTAESLTSPHDVASITPKGNETLIVASGSDPWVILLVGGLPLAFNAGTGWPFTDVSLVLASLAAVGLLAACFLAIALDLVRAARDGTLASSGPWAWIWLPVVFLLVFSAKLVLIREFPVTSPYWDQWDAEARNLFLPYYNSGLSWSQMFQFHNEHRIFFSRLLALDLLLMNGQWDPRLQQVVNAAMHSVTAVLLLAIVWRGLAWRRLELLAALIVPIFALPYAWENTLIGFQSQFYLFVLFSLLGLWLTTAFRAGSAAWWLGWACALCGLFNVASGILLPIVIAGVAVLEIMNPLRRWRELVLALAGAAALLVLGVLTASPPLPYHEPLKATTAGRFFAAFLHNMAWPWVESPAAGILMWLPIAAFLVILLIRQGRTSTFERFAIGLAAWVLLQAAALAYGRGGGALVPAPRYHDFLSLGFVANTLILIVAVRRMRAGPMRKGLAALMLIGWSGAALAGFDALTGASIMMLNSFRPHWEAQAANVRRFVLTGDGQELKSQPPSDLPYPSADSLIALLEQPTLRRLLPAAVRQPLRVQPRTVTNEAFVPYGAYPTTPNDPMRPSWGSYTGRGDASSGKFESLPMTCERGEHLSVPVAGYLGLADVHLTVRNVTTGETYEIKPPRVAREEWVNGTVPCPEGPFVLVAADRSDAYLSWFAFREPVETGWASLRAEALIDNSLRLMVGALVLMLVALKVT
jgi:hypothetical protein